MPDTASMNPAEQAAASALDEIYGCIDNHKSFRLEAGAGAGKTESLVTALRYLIDKQGNALLRRHQQIACITFTNVASDEIKSRTDRHQVIWSSTIHSFCWSMIKDFQPYLRENLLQIEQWLAVCRRGIAERGLPDSMWSVFFNNWGLRRLSATMQARGNSADLSRPLTRATA